MQPVDRQRNEQIASHLRGASLLIGQLAIGDLRWEGLNGSPAGLDHARIGASRGAGHVVALMSGAGGLAQLGLVVAAFELDGLAHLLLADEPFIYGPIAVSRAIGEVCGRVWWLMEPGIDPEKRLARALLEQLFGAHEAARMETAAKLPLGSTGATFPVDTVTDKITALGMSWEISDRGRVTVQQIGRPTTTSLFQEMYTDGLVESARRMLYSMESAVVHGSIHGLRLQLQYEQTGADGVSEFSTDVDQGFLDGSAMVSLFAFEAALDRAVIYLGWDRDTLAEFGMITDALFPAKRP